MNPTRFLPTAGVLFSLFLPAMGMADEKKDDSRISPSNPEALRTLFGPYGYHTRQTIAREADGFHFWLPSGVADVAQTGVYSFFSLAGDCEVTLTYELLKVQFPEKGYGTGVGLAFDAGDNIGRGTIQRLYKTGDQSVYALHSGVATGDGKMKEEDRFVPTTAKRGRLGLKRIKSELVFLVSDAPDIPMWEVDRLPFTDRTIQVVRFFADSGGSPTAVNVRVRQIEVHSDQMTGGVTEDEKAAQTQWWLWVVVPTAAAGLLLGFVMHRRARSRLLQ